MKTSGNASTLQWLVRGILLADSHEARHLILGEVDLAAPESGQRLIIKSIDEPIRSFKIPLYLRDQRP